jgi:hypothetical protein
MPFSSSQASINDVFSFLLFFVAEPSIWVQNIQQLYWKKNAERLLHATIQSIYRG